MECLLDAIRLSKENYKDYLPLDMVAFSFAFAGAMGDAGGVAIVTADSKLYYINFLEEDLTDEELYEILPILPQCVLPIIGDAEYLPDGWSHISMGAGNNLLIQTQFEEKFWDIFEQYQNHVPAPFSCMHRCWAELMLILLEERT